MKRARKVQTRFSTHLSHFQNKIQLSEFNKDMLTSYLLSWTAVDIHANENIQKLYKLHWEDQKILTVSAP